MTYPDTPACTESTTIQEPFGYVRVLPSTEVPLAIADPSGTTVLLPVCQTGCADAPPSDFLQLNRASEPHQFNAGGSGTQVRLGRNFTWTLAGGRLLVNYANGHSAEFTQASDERPGVGTVVATYTDGTATTFVMKDAITPAGTAGSAAAPGAPGAAPPSAAKAAR
jgi:hypothetical protein